MQPPRAGVAWSADDMRSSLISAMCVLGWLGCSGGDTPATPGPGPDPEPGLGPDAATEPPPPPDVDAGIAADSPAVASPTIQLNLLYVHGVNSDNGGRMRSHNSLNDLKNAVNAELPALIATFQAAHPGVTVTVASASANLYTAAPSPTHPSNSNDPILMDDWQVGDPGCAATRQGDPCTTAYEWRYRLVGEIHRLFPAGAKNLVIIGHSTGARTAFEVASNTGPGGVGAYDWGVQDQIAGVVSINGMIDGLQSNKYNVAGPFSFVTTCKDSDLILRVFGGSSPGNGWCEYAGDVSGVASADWVGQHKRSRVLISAGSCSPSLWTGNSDGSLPLAAEGSPFSAGLNTTPASGSTFTVAYGRNYGPFCHSTITNGGDDKHAAAVASAKANVLDFLFTSAVRVDQQGRTSTAGAIAFRASTPTVTLGGACPAGETGITPQLQVVGVCKHPGLFDGDDHAITDGFNVGPGAACDGTFAWSQVHDASNSHAATFFWQTRSVPAGGGLLSTLPPG